MPEVIFAPESLSELNEWTKTKCRIATKILDLIANCLDTPFEGLGKPEALKYNLTGYWSRRIDEGNRLVYCVTEGNIEIYSCKGHYDGQ